MKIFETSRQEAKNVKNVSDLLDFLGELTTEEANKLLKANHHYVRKYAIKYADRKSKIDRLFVENDSDIVKSILSSIDELTPEEANKLLKANHHYVREYALKYADRQSKIEWILGGLHDSDSVNSILNSLGELTVEEANKLLNSKNRMVKIYAMRNVNSKDLAELREIIVKGLIKWL